MVFKHCTGMIGETEESHDVDSRASKNIPEDQIFLSSVSKHVNNENVRNSYAPQERTDNLARIGGFAVGVGSLYVQEALGYPLIVLRHQCQVNHSSIKYHVLPFSLFRVIGRIYHRQGASVFWKGWGSMCVVKGITILAEVGICELLHLPRNDQERSISKTVFSRSRMMLHELLKGLSILITLPFYSTALSDSIQTLALDTQRSLFGFFKDAALRVSGKYLSRGHGRLLPFYSLVLPSVFFSLIRFTIKSFLSFSFDKIYSKTKMKQVPNVKKIQNIYYAELVTNLLSSLITEILMYPFETVLIRLHVQGTRTMIDDTDKGIGVVPLCTNYAGITDCVHTIKREEGMIGFYKGLGALILQYVLQAIIVKAAKPLYNVGA